MLVDMSHDIRMPYTGVATAARNLERDAALTRRFLRAMVRAVAYMRAYRQQTIDIVAKAEPQVDRRVFATEYDDFMPTLTADGTAPEALIRKDLEVRAALLDLPVSGLPPSDKVYDYRPLAAVNAELAASGWKPSP
jgi:ABC-type nitrate/sulfonate/bicarbonate transport system substrate-binding protein